MSRWNPWEILALSLGLLVAAQCVPARRGAWMVLVLTTVVALATRAFPLQRWCKLLCAPAGFLAVSTVVASLTVNLHHGSAPSLLLDPPTLAKTTDAMLRSIASLSCTLLLGSRSPVQWAAQLPSGSAWRFLADLAILMERYFYLLRDTARSIHRAQQARLAFVSRRVQIRSFALLCAALLGRTEDRSLRLQSAMDARLYTGELALRAPCPPLNALRMAWILALPIAVILLGRIL